MGASGLLAGCVSPLVDVTPVPRTSAPQQTGTPVRPTPSPTATSALPGKLPSKAQMVARFQGAKATQWDLNLTGELREVPKKLNAAALTFDACGSWHKGKAGSGSGYDEALIETLRTYKVKATLFLNARWIAENERVANELISDELFEIANHGVRHEPLSINGRRAYGLPGTKNLSVMYDEIVGAHEWISHRAPGTVVTFRSGTAYSDEVGVAMCQAMGTPFVGFNLNADAGATLKADQVATNVGKTKAGNIVIAHMNHPERGTANGFADALPRLVGSGLRFVHVSECL